MADVTGSEFEALVELLSELACVSTLEGSKELCGLISDQAELTSEFKVKSCEQFVFGVTHAQGTPIDTTPTTLTTCKHTYLACCSSHQASTFGSG